jgi:tetratricopeptide (TPR) repeat protein
VADPAHSQTQPGTQRQLEEGFRAVLQNPADMGINAAYAERLIDAGEYEKAIASLERILITDPSQAQIRVEIGALYFRLGSYETARTYFQRALADPNLPAELKPKCEQFLADIKERLSPSQFTGFGSVGARWDSNANTGSDNTLLRAGGITVNRPASTRPQSDFSFFGAGKVQHDYDLDLQDEGRIESTLLGYGSAYTRFSHQDVVLGELTTGFRFKPAPTDLKDLSIRPHIIANYVGLDGDRYLDTYGFGLDVTMTWSERLASELTFEYRREDYGPIATLGDTQHQTGDAKVVKLRTAYELAANQLLIADLYYRSDAARRGYYDYTHYQGVFTYSLTYQAPGQLTPRPWTVSPYVGWYSRGYAAPDPTIDPVHKRDDDQVRLGVQNSIPIAEGWSTFQQAEHIWGLSNIPNYDYRDTVVMIGLTRTF